MTLLRPRLIAFTLLVLAASATASAKQDAPISEEAAAPLEGATTLDTEMLLNAPTVTASGSEQSRALAPANVVTWESDELRRHGWTTLAEVLANTPGLYVIDDLVLPSLGVRGVGPGLRGGTRLVRIMINGVQVNFRPDLTAFLGQEYIPFETVERIEIAKGPLSSLYGANAFLATVNVITKQPTDGFHGQLGVRGRVIRGKGGFGFGGEVEYGTEVLGLMVGYDQANLKRSGMRLQRTFPAQDPSSAFYTGFFDRQSRNDDSKPRSMYASMDVRGGEYGTLKLQAGRQVLQSGAEFQPASVLTGASEINLTNTWLSLQYTLPIGESLRFGINADYAKGGPGDRDVLVATGEPEFRYTRNFAYTAVSAGAFAQAELPQRLSAKVGIDYTDDNEKILYFTRTEVDTGTRLELDGGDSTRERTLTNFGVYGQLGGNPIDGLQELHVVGNVRVDSPNLFDTQFTYRGGVAYAWSPRLMSKFFVGQAFQTPSAVQLFARPGFGIVYNTVGNQTLASTGLPGIQPQRVFSTELATTFAVTDRVVLEGSLYYQRVMDKVEFLPVTASATTNYSAINLSDQEFFGAELGVRASSARFSEYLTVSTQMLTNRDQDGSMTFKFDAPREFPTYTVYGGLTTRLPEVWTAVDVVGRLVGPRGATTGNTLINGGSYDLPAYVVFDLTLTSLDLRLIGDLETRLTASMRNVFDNRFTYPSEGGFDIPNIGRSWYFAVTQTF